MRSAVCSRGWWLPSAGQHRDRGRGLHDHAAARRSCVGRALRLCRAAMPTRFSVRPWCATRRFTWASRPLSVGCVLPALEPSGRCGQRRKWLAEAARSPAATAARHRARTGSTGRRRAWLDRAGLACTGIAAVQVLDRRRSWRRTDVLSTRAQGGSIRRRAATAEAHPRGARRLRSRSGRSGNARQRPGRAAFDPDGASTRTLNAPRSRRTCCPGTPDRRRRSRSTSLAVNPCGSAPCFLDRSQG